MPFRYILGDWNDTISGGSSNVLFYGMGGDDQITQTGQFNTLHGNHGNDTIIGGTSASVFGDDGNDTLSAGADSGIHGGAGDDYIFITKGTAVREIMGESGNDLIRAKADRIIIWGGGDNDTIFGGGTYARIYGDAGDDLISASGNGLVVNGGSGDDIIRSDHNESIFGGDGNDRIRSGYSYQIDAGSGNDTVTTLAYANVVDHEGADCVVMHKGGLLTIFASGTPDDDRYINKAADPVITELELSDFTTAVAIDLKTGVASGAELGNDTIMGFNRFTLGIGDDTIFGSNTRGETIDAHAGNDLVNGRGGNDWIDGGRGNDTICGGAGDDRLFGGYGSNSGDDILRGGDGNDYLIAGNSEDGGDGSDQLFGGAGDDSLRDGRGNDSMYGGDGNDILTHFTGGNDQFFGGAGADRFQANVSGATQDMADIMDFEDGVDTIRLGSGPVSFYLSSAAQVGDDVEIGCFRIHNFTLAQLDLSDFF